MAGFKLAEIDGKYWKLSEKTGQKTQIDASEYAQIQTARDTGPIEAAFVQGGSRINNALNKVGLGSGEEQTRLAEGSMDQLNNERPVASFMGDMAAYGAAPALAAAAAPVASVGIPAAMGIGALEGYALSNPGEGFQDTLIGGASAGAGNMLGRVLQRISPFGKPAYKSPALTTRQLQTGKQGTLERGLANTTAGRGPANLFGRENQIRLNQLVAESVGFNPRQTRRLSSAMLDRAENNSAKALKEIDGELNQSIRNTEGAKIKFEQNNTPENLQDWEDAANISEQIKRQWDGVAANKQSVMAVRGAITKDGNVDMDKLYRSYSRAKDTMVADGVSQDVIDAQFKGMKPIFERLDQLTDPELGAFFSDSTKAEEVLANVFRGILPGTGWASYANFLPSLAPVGKGGNAGAFGGLLANPALDNLQGQAAAELSNWLDDPDKNTLDRAKDVGGAVMDAGKVGLLAVPGYKAGKSAARVIKGNLVN